MTLALVLLNVAVYIVVNLVLGAHPLRVSTGDPIYLLAQENGAILQGETWRLGTALVIHWDLLHLIGNLFGLILFGIRVEDMFGKRRALLAFFGAGLFANGVDLGIYAIGLAADLPVQVVFSGGASGCVYGLIGAYVVGELRRNPRQLKFYLVVTIAYVFLSYRPGIDVWAHFFGLLAGALLGWRFSRRR